MEPIPKLLIVAFCGLILMTCAVPGLSQTNVIRALPAARTVHPTAGVTRLTQTNGIAGAAGVRLLSTLKREVYLTATGARADYGRLKVSFESDIGAPRPVTVVTPDLRVLKFRPSYLVLENRATGESLLLGEVTNRIGEVLLPDTVRWTNVLDSGPAVAIELRYTKESLEQNVIVSESVEGFIPKKWRLDDLSLEFWTEWLDSNPSASEARKLTLRKATHSAPAVQAEDATVTFGHSRVVAGGRAFTIGQNGPSLPVSKSWVQVPVSGAKPRVFLIESLDLLSAKPQIDALPAPRRRAMLKPKINRSEMLRVEATEKRLEEAKEEGGKAKNHSLLVARSGESGRGFVIDFQIINTVPVPSGVIGWWPAGGDALDATANHNDGTLYNGATFAAGEVGEGFSFDGSSYVGISNNPSLNPTNGMTFEGWVYLDYFDGNHSIFRKDGECSNRQFLLTVSPSQTFRAHVGSTNGNYYYIDSTNTVVPGTWYYVAMTYDVASSNLSLYVNGDLNSSGVAVGAIVQTPENLYIGGGPNPCWEYDFPGLIDEPAFYGRALSPSEIQSIYEASAAGKINPGCVGASTNSVGWWSADLLAFDIAHTNMGTLENGTTFAPGVVGQAFSFDGVDDYIRVPDNPDLDPTNQLTIEAWVYLNTYDYDNFVVVRKDGECSERQYMLTASPYGTFRAHVGLTNGGYYYVDSAVTPEAQTWYHLAETYDGTNLCIYVNGALDASAPLSGQILTTAQPLCIGGTDASACWAYFLSGIIDEPAIYNRALSAGEIAAIYSAGCAGKCKVDTDNDGLTDLQEALIGTDPSNPDSNANGLLDGEEFFVFGKVPKDSPFKVNISRPRNGSSIP